MEDIRKGKGERSKEDGMGKIPGSQHEERSE